MRNSTEMELTKTRWTWRNCSQIWDMRWWNTQTSQQRYFVERELKSKHILVWFIYDKVTEVWIIVFWQAIDDAVIRFSKHRKLKETDSVLVVLMSHGKLGAVLGVETSGDDDKFPINNIYKHLGSEKCPELLDKPKIIIIQACRGGDSYPLFKTHQT